MIRVSTNNLYANANISINSDQSALMSSQAQLSSGKQINSPMDNPVGAAQAALLQSDVNQLAQYKSNQGQATALLNNASSTMTQVINVMQSVRTSLVQANNGSLTDSDRANIASQLQQDFNQLVGLANTSDSQGGYLFGGSANSGPPFAQSGNNVSYVGDNIAQGLQISQTRTEQVKYPGSAVFMQIPSGNGTFVTAAASSNTGSGAISTGTVTNPSLLTGDSYTISVTAGGAIQVKDNTKTAANGGVAVYAPVTPTSYSNPTTLSFDGMQMTLSGAPAATDTFTVSPSTNQSIFTSIASVISALKTPTPAGTQTAAQVATVTSALGSADQALTNLTTTQASMGSQLAELNTYGTINSDQTLQAQTQISAIVDLNYATGVSKLTQQTTQYQAALQSYSAISKLSLFNYL